MAFMEIVISLLCLSTVTALYSTVFRTVVIKLMMIYSMLINVNVEEMKTIVIDLASNKYPGLDSVYAEHTKCAGPKLCVIMSMVISSILIHGFIPRSMMESDIVPVNCYGIGTA